MKDQLITMLGKAMIKVAKVYNGNVSPEGFYKPKKVK